MLQGARAIKFPWPGLLKIGFLVLLIIAANLLAGWMAGLLKFELLPSNEEFVHRMIMTAAVAYAVLLATPFVPGIEFGLALIGMLGPPIVFLVYVSTVVGLSLSFAVGRLISLGGLIKLLDDFRLQRASQLFATIEPMSTDERLTFLLSRAPRRIVPFLLRNRYLSLAILFNLPGNFLIGGGGGIAMIAGVSGLYSALGFFVTIVIAVSPLPFAILVFGKEILPG
jgi:hypothetical protein